MRDDFSVKIKELLSKRVGSRCSNPSCKQLTSGPQENPDKAVNIGVAAHITAASPDGPRFDETISPQKRSSSENGIWLCQNCAKLIDNDPSKYPTELLLNWRKGAEERASNEIEGKSQTNILSNNLHPWEKIETLMPYLVAEMRDDLANYPLRREFVLLKKCWSYWANVNELMYYFDDHPDLKSKIRVLQNLDLVYDITFNEVDRYTINEEFADYLTQ
jgi:hypothetical protein